VDTLNLPTIPLTAARRRLSDDIFDRIADAIVTGAIAQGEVLRDAELAEQLGTSRTPVREAFMRLERAGLIETAPSRFTRVITVTESLAADAVEYSAHWYGAAAYMATQKMDQAQRDEALRRIDAVIDDGDDDRFYAAIRALFGYLVECSGNALFTARGLDVLYLVELATRQISRSEAAKARNHAQAALRASIADRDPEAAARAVRAAHGLSSERGGESAPSAAAR
jgi:DNA-binding GntR family transcriptional regulator